MKDLFIVINDKVINMSDLLHVAPTKSGKNFICSFKSNESVLWLTPDDFQCLKNKLTFKTKKSVEDPQQQI